MTPGMAQGSCSAMRDAINLAWRLDLVLGGRAPDSVLDSYGPERLAHVAPLIQGSLVTWALTTETDPDKVAARDAFLRSGEVSFPPTPTLTTGFLQGTAEGSPAPPVGSLSPQGRVRIGERSGLLDDLVGFGFQLVSRIPVAELLTPAHTELPERLGVHIVVLDPDHVEDVDGTYRTFLDDHGLAGYLSRPDFYVFGTAATGEDLPALIDALAAALTRSELSATSAAAPPVPLPGAAFARATLPVAGFTLHYAEAAPAAPLGTIVSLPGSAGLEMSTAKDRLAERYRVVEITPPGLGRPDGRVPAHAPERDRCVAGRGDHTSRRRAVRPAGDLHGWRQRPVHGCEDPGPGPGRHPRSDHGAVPTAGPASPAGRSSCHPSQQAVGHPWVRHPPDGQPAADDTADTPGPGRHRGDRRRA